MSLDQCIKNNIDVPVWKIMNKLILILVPDHHQRLRDVRDDFASQRPWPARFPRQLWRHRGRCGALRLRLEGWAEAGQPTGGDLQGGCGYSHPRADDRPVAHICQCESGDNPASWRRHPQKVTPHPCFLFLHCKLFKKSSRQRCLQNSRRFPICLVLWFVRQRSRCSSKMYEDITEEQFLFLICHCSWSKLAWHLLSCLRWLAWRNAYILFLSHMSWCCSPMISLEQDSVLYWCRFVVRESSSRAVESRGHGQSAFLTNDNERSILINGSSLTAIVWQLTYSDWFSLTSPNLLFSN